jgi:hypothetical protein
VSLWREYPRVSADYDIRRARSHSFQEGQKWAL